jgi:hypothetical protein
VLRALALAALAALVTVGLLAAGDGLQRARAAGGEGVRPNLVADPPDNFLLETDSSTGAPRLLLRFNGYVHNAGPGALDFRGSRAAPKVSPATEEQVERAREKRENLPQKVEEELAVPPMKVFQRLFTTAVGQEETNVNRAHLEESSSGVIEYVSADGHHHWHLQRVAKYSLWNEGKSEEVTPAQKVGFCLEDSQHVETSKGPSSPVYADNVPPFRDFCQQYRPNATSLFEGISPGWRDVYDRGLSLQWVDASNVLPGRYWLREEINPLGYVKETGGGEKTKFATVQSVIPGFDAEPQAVVAPGRQETFTLHSHAYNDGETPVYTIVTPPKHGSLGPVKGNTVVYTPNGSYGGPDSFTFSTRDPNSPFPHSPAVAAFAIQGETPSLAISGAREQLIAGTSVALSAIVGHDVGGVEWEATKGSLSTREGAATSYTAPPETGAVTITARLRDDPEVSAQVTINVVPVPPPEPAPALPHEEPKPAPPPSPPPPGSGNAGYTQEVKPGVSRPRTMWFGRYLVMTTTPTVAGKVRLTAYRGKHVLGTCTALTPAGRVFTCRLKPGASASRRTRISVLASLRAGGKVYDSLLPAQRVPEMKMKPAGAGAHAATAGHVYWCSPSTLVPTLAGGEE